MTPTARPTRASGTGSARRCRSRSTTSAVTANTSVTTRVRAALIGRPALLWASWRPRLSCAVLPRAAAPDRPTGPGALWASLLGLLGPVCALVNRVPLFARAGGVEVDALVIPGGESPLPARSLIRCVSRRRPLGHCGRPFPPIGRISICSGMPSSRGNALLYEWSQLWLLQRGLRVPHGWSTGPSPTARWLPVRIR